MPGFNIANQGSGPSAYVEPSRLHRFRLDFRNTGMGELSMYALSVQRPTPEFDQITIHHKQTEGYYPGKHRWNPINVRFYEITDLPGGPTASQIFQHWAMGQGPLDLPTNTINNKFGKTNADILLLPGGGPLNENVMPFHIYSLYGLWLQKVEPAELNYSDSGISTIQVTFRFDAAFERAELGQLRRLALEAMGL